MNVIIVDDDRLVRDFLVHALEFSLNRKALTFESGLQAWLFVQEHAEGVDAVFADQDVPDMEGLELLQQIKSAFPQKIFVLLGSDPSLEGKASHYGADAFICKPFDINDLFEIVQRFIPS